MGHLMKIFCLVPALAGCAMVTAADRVSETDFLKIYTVQGGFNEVYEFVELAITAQGMKINNVSHIGKMLSRTAEAVGSDKKIYQSAKALEFCSAVVSRNMMEADPRNIVYCPYVIYVYQLVGEDDTVHVAYRKPWAGNDAATVKALAPVTELLEQIIGEALQ